MDLLAPVWEAAHAVRVGPVLLVLLVLAAAGYLVVREA